jgi:Putative viral replication protein
MPCPQSKRYCFTIPNEPGVDIILKQFKDEHCQYLLYHLERETGPALPGLTHHCLHGFFTMKKKISMTGIHRALRRKHFTHLATATQPSIEIAAYHKKNDNYTEYGTPSFPGERTDLSKRSSKTDIDAIKELKRFRHLNQHDQKILEWLKAKQIRSKKMLK